MLSPEFVNAKELRQEIGKLNAAGILKDKLKTVGVKKPDLVSSFINAIDSIPEDSEEAKKIPDSVILFYNGIVEGEDPSPEEQEKMKKKKAPKQRGPSREQVMTDLVAKGASDDEIKKEFTQYYATKGVTDEAFIEKRIKIYKGIAKKALGQAEPKKEKPKKDKPKKEKAAEAEA